MSQPSPRSGSALIWLVLGIACLGPVLGLLWWAISPVVPGVVVQVAIYPRETEPGGYIATDAYFAILTAVVGLVVAFLVRRRWTGSDGLALAGLTLGGLAGSALAVLTGYAFSAPSRPQASAGSYVDVPLSLGATGWLLVWPIFSVGYCFFAQLWTLETESSAEATQTQIAQLDEIGN
ncbi:unannotated protein [freshwater metagenome]|uniref:Unannotated protein n=1 Tax=freshwater metagenome TaxID=449393 RepID=A0A6J6C4T2_9ZZZZ